MGAIVIRTRFDEGTESAEVATSGHMNYICEFNSFKVVLRRLLMFSFHYTNALIQVNNKKNSEDIRLNVLKLHWSKNHGKSPLTHELNPKKQTQMDYTSLLKLRCT